MNDPSFEESHYALHNFLCLLEDNEIMDFKINFT